MEKIERIDRKLIHKGAILDIYEDTVRLPNGKEDKWDFVSHRMGAACVLAVRPDGKLIMVRQYRNALDRFTLEVPAGKRDSLDEDTKICAARELEEETGYRAGKLEKLLSLKTTVAFCDEFIDVYLATDLEKLVSRTWMKQRISISRHMTSKSLWKCVMRENFRMLKL